MGKNEVCKNNVLHTSLILKQLNLQQTTNTHPR